MSADALVLCYHALSERFPAQLSTTPERFSRQLRSLARRGYRGITFYELVRGTPGRTVAVTFDDGYRSVLDLGLPILRELGWPATIFVPTDLVGGDAPMNWPGIDHWLGGKYESELLPLSWEQLDTLAGHGWEIGSHTSSHPHLTSLADAALSHELEASKQACERRLGRACQSLAYPYGDVDERVVAAAAKAGYETAAALPGRFGQRSPLRWPRVGIYHKDTQARFALKCSPPVRRLLGR
jgi:peptidoglycan/xylan/chitin deacetylase (PgdA/CDA1 family)